MTDDFRLDRFVAAQDRGGVYDAAVAELHAGRKTSHWMWFVFPQIAGLGSSAMAQPTRSGQSRRPAPISAHPVLGPRLLECARILVDLDGRSAADVFGSIDAMKLRSSMTLFGAAAPQERLFAQVLDQYFDGRPDDATLRKLAS